MPRCDQCNKAAVVHVSQGDGSTAHYCEAHVAENHAVIAVPADLKLQMTPTSVADLHRPCEGCGASAVVQVTNRSADEVGTRYFCQECGAHLSPAVQSGALKSRDLGGILVRDTGSVTP